MASKFRPRPHSEFVKPQISQSNTFTKSLNSNLPQYQNFGAPIIYVKQTPTILRHRSAAAVVNLRKDQRLKNVNKIQKINCTFEETLLSNQNSKEANSTTYETSMDFSKPGMFYQLANKGVNLKFHLIRQLLEQQEPYSIKALSMGMSIAQQCKN